MWQSIIKFKYDRPQIAMVGVMFHSQQEAIAYAIKIILKDPESSREHVASAHFYSSYGLKPWRG